MLTVSPATSRLQCSECSVYCKLIYGALNSCCVRALTHASDNVISVVSGCDLTIDKRMRTQISGKDIIMNVEAVSAKTVLGDLC